MPVSPRREGLMARYEEIALELAQGVAKGEIRIGEKMTGRSALAGRYKVSPETVRRAVALLHVRGIVKTVPGTGIIVESKALAQNYVQEAERTLALLELENEVKGLIDARKDLDARLDEAIGRIVRATAAAISTIRHVEEIEVPEDSPFLGKTLMESGLRERTGASVIGIARASEEIFSPSPLEAIRAADLLVVVGTDEAKDLLRSMVEGRAPRAGRRDPGPGGPSA